MSRAALRFVSLAYRSRLGATIHPHESVVGWLHEAGFEAPIRSTVGPTPGNSLIEARLPE